MPNYIHPDGSVLNGTIKVKYSGRGGGRKKTGQLTYVVYGETVSTNEDSIAQTTGIPQIYDEINGMWCVDQDLVETGPAKHPVTEVDTRRWEVTCIFDSDLDTTQDDLNPLLRPAIIRRNGRVVTKRLNYDQVTGNPVVTGAGEPINLTTKYVVPIYTITRFEAYPFSDTEFRRLNGATNNATFNGAPIGTCYLQLATEEVTIANTKYEKATYTIEFHLNDDDISTPNTVNIITIPHVGTIYKDGSDYLSADRDGVYRGTLHYLDSSGEKLDWSDPIEFLNINALRKTTYPTF
jgi:hypothetical protein